MMRQKVQRREVEKEKGDVAQRSTSACLVAALPFPFSVLSSLKNEYCYL